MPKKELLTPDEAKKKVEGAIDELVTLAQLHEKAVKASTKTSGKAQQRAMRAAEETRAALMEATSNDAALFASFAASIKAPNLFDPPPGDGAGGGKVTPIPERTKH